MGRYKKVTLVTCPQCGLEVKARGLNAHYRMSHPGLSLEAIKSLPKSPKSAKPVTKVTAIKHPMTIQDLLARMGVERPKSSLESLSSERVSHFKNLGQELAAIAWDREQYRRLGELDAATEEYLSDLVRQAKIKWGH